MGMRSKYVRDSRFKLCLWRPDIEIAILLSLYVSARVCRWPGSTVNINATTDGDYSAINLYLEYAAVSVSCALPHQGLP